MIDFAILAPVPEMHLRSGQPVARDTGYVSFGSQKFELFRTVDQLRGDDPDPVPILIYPSYELAEAKLSFLISWTAWYVGHVQLPEDKRADEPLHRPPTTEETPGDDSSGWAIFWRARDLNMLPEDRHVPISAIQTKKGYWRKNHPPRGPEIVARPEWI